MQKTQTREGGGHVAVLDGVRAVSIIAVLITHLLPVRLGGQVWNASVGMFGMALFFVLSGYLITGQLLKRPSVGQFAARRLCRILPAAWLCLALVWLALPLDPSIVWSNFLFYANLPPQRLVPPIDHFWSLCVEIQFYALVMLLLWLRPALAWWLLPTLLLAVTGIRIAHGVTGSSVTWYRADDLLAGATLALVMKSAAWPRAARALRLSAVIWMLLLSLCVACLFFKSHGNWFSYLRPYLAAALVGALMAAPDSTLSRRLCHPWLTYVATISYALYVWHLPLAATWLGSGDLLEKYLKRPLLLIVLFFVAHLSTFHFERRFIDWGKRIAQPRVVRAGTS